MPYDQSVLRLETAAAPAEEYDDAEDQDALDVASVIHQMVRDQLREFGDEADELRNMRESVERASAKDRCPLNGQQGQRVERRTLQSLLLADLQRLVTKESYWFCAAPTCPVVYFDDSGAVTFTVEQVRVPVWQKQATEPNTPICYCFNITNRMLNKETMGEIAAGIRQGLCACPVTNPQGSCCLGNVRRATKIVQSTQAY